MDIKQYLYCQLVLQMSTSTQLQLVSILTYTKYYQVLPAVELTPAHYIMS